MEDIDGVLGHENIDHDFTHFKDRLFSIETIQSHIGGVKEERCLNTNAFPLDFQCLTYIMVFSLYSVRKMSTINNARAIFLMELCEKIYIDIGAHLYYIIAKATRTTTSAKLVLPSLIMRILHENGVETPQDISLMTSPPSINSQTILKSRVRLPRKEQAEEPKEAPLADTETEAEGQQPPPRKGSGRGRSRASLSSSVPPDAFQIILEKIDGLRDVQTEHSNNLTAIQDQINLLAAKFDSFTHQP